MCKKCLEEIPSGIMNFILIIFISFIIVLRVFNRFPGCDIQFIQVLALLFGTFVVGNSITLYRSKTVSNELIRSDIDTINHGLTNEKLKIETYNAVLSVNHNAGDSEDKKLDEKEAKNEAEDALKVYLDLCKKLKAKSESGDIVYEIFSKCLDDLEKNL